MKRARIDGDEEREKGICGSVNFDENLVYEVLRHVDARMVAAAVCMSKLWRKTARDEWLCEVICTSHWSNIGCANHQLRSVVLALRIFCRIHFLYLWPLYGTHNSAWAMFPSAIGKSLARWGKDEVHLTFFLISI